MNKKAPKTKILALDTEDNSLGHVYLINFYDGETHNTFTDQDEALKWFLKQKGHVTVWCTNLQYDLTNFLGHNLGLVQISYVGSRVISAQVPETDLKFADTLNHWKISVKEMGDKIGIKKIKVPESDDPERFNNVEYCRRDTEITWHFVNAMAENYKRIGATLKPTIGSTALALFYSEFHHRPKKSEIAKTEEIEFIQKGYYGGRTEIFHNKPIEGRIQYVDVNSLYPSVMKEFKYPCLGERYFTTKPDFKKEGMVDVTLEAPEIDIPYLPCRDPKTKSLCFPIGKFRGLYTYFEIREARKIGYRITQVHRALEYVGSYAPFEKFVDKLYGERLKAQAAKDDLMSDAYKLLLNNLYGKFGQKNEYQKLVPYKISDLKNGDVLMGDHVLRSEKGEYSKHANAIWAAYTTAYARHKLYIGLKKVETENGLLIYCDTDSVIFESAKDIFKDSRNLGEFKLEGRFDYAWFKLPKLYHLIENKTGKKSYRAKGVPRKSAEDFFTTGRAKFRRPYKIREVLRRNLSPKRKVKLIANYWDTFERNISKKYDKRIVGRDGSTRPLRVDLQKSN